VVQVWPRGNGGLDLAVLQLSSPASKFQRYFLPATFDDVRFFQFAIITKTNKTYLKEELHTNEQCVAFIGYPQHISDTQFQMLWRRVKRNYTFPHCTSGFLVVAIL